MSLYLMVYPLLVAAVLAFQFNSVEKNNPLNNGHHDNFFSTPPTKSVSKIIVIKPSANIILSL
jgi:hypothetical protein